MVLSVLSEIVQVELLVRVSWSNRYVEAGPGGLTSTTQIIEERLPVHKVKKKNLGWAVPDSWHRVRELRVQQIEDKLL